jgi:polar amino acid transport system substrate-binding protein
LKRSLSQWAWVCVVLAGWMLPDGESHGDDGLRKRLAANVLRWGGDAEGGAPYLFYDPQQPDRLIGFEVDLIDALVAQVGKRTGLPELKPEFVSYKWVSLPQGLDKRDFDVIFNGLEITEENRRAMIFSRPYYVYSQQLTVRADETRIKGVDDCLDRPIGTLSGSAANRLLTRLGAGKITAFEGQIEPYQDLKIGRVDAVLLDLPIAVYNTLDDPLLKFVGPRVGFGYYGAGLRPEDRELAAALDDALSVVMRDGTLRKIYTKWRLWNDEQVLLAKFDEPEETAGLNRVESAEATTATSRQRWTFAAYAPLLLRAAGVTVALTFASMAVAMTIGLVVAVCRLYGGPVLRLAALAYVEFFRGTPLLLLLTFLYFGLPHVPYLGVELTAWQAAIIGFGLNYAAFEAEIYRSSILAVPRGQWEAAQALGMDDVTTFRRVVFPQAFRTALGPMTNDFVAMFKDTSLVGVIAVVELTQQYQILARSSLMWLEMGLLTAGLYLAMSVPLGYLARYLEHRWSAGLR